MILSLTELQCRAVCSCLHGFLKGLPNEQGPIDVERLIQGKNLREALISAFQLFRDHKGLSVLEASLIEQVVCAGISGPPEVIHALWEKETSITSPEEMRALLVTAAKAIHLAIAAAYKEDEIAQCSRRRSSPSRSAKR